jgi:hypothetical protein
VTHRLAVLIHFIAAHNGEPAYIANHPLLCEMMPDGFRLDLIRSSGIHRVELDQYWLLLTERGKLVASEGLLAMNGAA